MKKQFYINHTSHFNKLTAVLRKLQSLIYKTFIRPHLDYCDVMYLMSRLESAQYNAALAITGAIPGTMTVKIYQKLGFESVRNRNRRKLRRLGIFYKIYNDQSLLYLYNLISARTLGNYPLQNFQEIPIIKMKHRFFETSFFPCNYNRME